MCIAKNILEKGLKNYNIFGERQWKDKITKHNFNKV